MRGNDLAGMVEVRVNRPGPCRNRVLCRVSKTGTYQSDM